MKDRMVKRLQAMQAQQMDLLRRWEEGDLRLWSRTAGEGEKDLTEDAKAEMRRLIDYYEALIQKIEGAIERPDKPGP